MIGESTGNGNEAGGKNDWAGCHSRSLRKRRKSAVSDPVRGRPVTKTAVVLPREVDAVPPRSLRKKALATSKTASGNEVVYRADSLPIVLLADIRLIGMKPTGRCHLIPHHRDALNDPLALKVVDDKMLGTSVIPNTDRSRFPAVAYGEFGGGHPFREVPQQDVA